MTAIAQCRYGLEMRLLPVTALLLVASCAPPPSPRPPASPAPAASLAAPPPLPSAPTPTPTAPDPAQKFVDLGTCPLESGETIASCRIGYRTFGTLDATKSNVVLFPTWFTGTTKSLVDVVPDKLVDTKRFYLVLVDALGDGVSTSPSNSVTQPRLAFPRFGIRDMVESQRRMLERLGITHLRAVVGISMGGMQAIQWGVTHPELVDRIVPIVGSPQLTSNDLLLWTAELNALESDVAYAKGNYQGRPTIRSVQDIHALGLVTPAYRAAETSREAFPKFLASFETDTSCDWNDWHRQLEAMMAHDVAKPYGSLEAAAKRVKSKALFVVADQDHMVSPIPARAFAKQIAGATVAALEGPCGHIATGCEAAKLSGLVTSFLQ